MTFVTLPYSYRVQGVLAKDKSVKLHRVLDSIVVDVPERNSVQVPIAFSFDHHGREAREVYRADGGRPVQPMPAPSLRKFESSKEPMSAVSFEEAAARVLSQDVPIFWSAYPLDLPTKDHFGEVSSSAPLHGRARFKSIVRNRMEEDRAAAVAFGAGLVLVDGVLHCRVPEPRWVVVRDISGNDPNVRLRASSSKHAGGEPFRMDRRDDAMRFARNLAGGGARVTVESGADDSGLIEWKHDDARESAIQAAGAIMGAVGNAKANQLRFMDLSFFAPMCELRKMWRDASPRSDILQQIDILEAALENCTDPWCKDLVALVRETIDLPLQRQREYEALPEIEAPELENFSMVLP